jgi:undecaprenyl diphosphate synthase
VRPRAPDSSSRSFTVNQRPESWPRHVAVIMDGNGRWARRRGLPSIQGHRAGVKSARAAMEVCRDQGIAYLTLYTFSLENWQRPRAEVDELMRLLNRYLSREARRMVENRIRFRALGRLELLPPKIRAKVAEITAVTAANERLNLCLALSYGGRAEIVDAINAHAAARAARGMPAAPITAADLAAHLYAPDVPPPDLLIRTSGEKRLSNFLLWESARARLAFVDDLWPDFTAKRFTSVLAAERAGRAAEAGTA